MEIEFQQRETFAYACEAYSRILELGHSKKERLDLLAEIEEDERLIVEKVDTEKYKRALRAAVESRNGWKQILAICAPKPLPTQQEIIVGQ